MSRVSHVLHVPEHLVSGLAIFVVEQTVPKDALTQNVMLCIRSTTTMTTGHDVTAKGSRALSLGAEARAAITIDKTLEDRVGEVVPQPWEVLGRRLQGEQPALACNRGCPQDSGEGRVRCADEGRSCNSGTVGRAALQEESACHSATHTLRLSEMLSMGQEYRMSFLSSMGARCEHTLPDSTNVQWEMRLPEERFGGDA